MNWPLVPLGELLIERRERIGTPDASGLPLLGVSNAEGLHRSMKERIADMSRYFHVRRDWFAYNPMRINVGSIGWAETEQQTGVISPDYVVFSCGERILSSLLYRFLRSRVGLDAINFGTAGSVRERLYFESLTRISFPLPPLTEQERIVARVDAIAARVAEAQRLSVEGSEDSDRVLTQMAHRADLSESEKQAAGWQQVPLGEVLTQTWDSVTVDSSASYPNFGIYSYARGLFLKPPISGLETSATALYRVRTGQFIYSRLFAFEGSYGWVTPEFDGLFVSAEYPTFDCKPGVIRAEFLAAYFKSKNVWAAVAMGSKGLGDRRQRVQPKQLLAHRLWLPPIQLQNRLAETWVKLDALRALQAETATELDALLPSVLNRAFAGRL